MKKIYEILKTLNSKGYEAYIVGGYVRDKLLNKESLDIDICTAAPIENIKELFPNSKYIDCFCSSLKVDNYNVQITTFRKDFDYDGRKPLKIEKAHSLLEDLNRRDFTINTICLDASGNIIDLLDGISDLNNKLLKVVGNSDDKIKEDSLRILRAIRFSTTLRFALDKALEEAIKKYASNVQNLSIYRKREELDKILLSPNFKKGLDLIKKFNLDTYLNINFKEIKYCHNYLGMYAQIDINVDNFFTSKELKQINLLKKYLDKKLDLYDMYILKEENLKIIEEITSKNLVNIYQELPIKQDSDLDISYEQIEEILKKKNLKYSDVKDDIIRKILNKEINNQDKEIINYINNNY